MIYMKARFSHYINKGLSLCLAGALLVCSVEALAQGPYEEALKLNPFMSGGNVAGIRGQMDMTVRLMPNKGNGRKAVSYAKLNGVYEAGGFKGADDAVSLYGFGTEAATILHLPMISMVGSFAFNQKEGKDMCGSMFIHPGYYPIDAVEFTPGQKTLQEYGFSGGVSSDIGQHWLIGGKIDFISSNYAKRKDIRHTNYSLDLKVAPSVVYKAGNWNFGLSYIFRKTSEYTKAESLGTATADTYYAFLDKGIMWGTNQVWNGNGLHLTESGVDRLPVKENTNGIGIQIQHRKGLYFDAEYKISNGEVGEKGFLWYKFPGRELSVNLSYTFINPDMRQISGLHYSSSAQINQEAVIDKVTNGGITTPMVYGFNNIFSRSGLKLNAEYDLYYKHIAEFHTSAGYGYDNMVSTLVYPYHEKESFQRIDINASGLYRFGYFELGAELGFMKGLKWQADSYSAENAASGLASEPYRLEERYNIWREYLLAARVRACLSIRYFVSGYYINGIYFGAKVADTHAFGLNVISGNDRFQSMLEIGYRF